MKTIQRLCHLHLEDGFGNKETLVCNLIDGAIRYAYYSGWSDGGMPQSLSNLQCELPIEKSNDDETIQQFVDRIIHAIKYKSVVNLVKKVQTQVSFN